MKNCLFFLLLLSLTALPESFAQTPTCSPKQDGDVISTLASAGTFANLANKKGSLKYELSSLVSEGLDKLEAQSSSPESPYLTLSVIPNKFKDDYSDIETCKRLENQTTKSPIHYKDINFKSKDELVEWFFDFTQGNGTLGEDLYTRCPGSCSPQYTTFIRKDKSQLLLEVSVVCGHARDKWDDQYKLTMASSTSCQGK